MKKKITSLVLVLGMLISLLSGCAKKDEAKLNIIDDNYRNYYEIFVYSYYDSNSDGIGDLNGVTQKLDYISEMGFNGIWLMPIMTSTTYHKYDVVDYMTVDPDYGTNEDFKALVDAAHEKGINVIIDFVMNHTSSKHVWFTTACEYLASLEEGEEPSVEECPYVEYYNFTKEKKGGTFYSVPGSEWCYEGEFWSEMPDLNLQSEKVRAEFEEIGKYWINEMGVDGFRMDAVVHFEEDDVVKNNEILDWYYQYCLGLKDDFYMVSEAWVDKSTIAKYYGSQTPSFFNFDASQAEGIIMETARGVKGADDFVNAMVDYDKTYGANNPNYIDAPFLTNHDNVRSANSLGGTLVNMKMAAGLLLTMNGSPFVYYGEEIGLTSQGTKDENKRVPMYWNANDWEGECTGFEGMDSNIKKLFPSVVEQQEDENSLLNYYKNALLLRNQNPEIARGEITVISELTNDDYAVITKEYEGSVIAIIYNTSEETKEIDLTGTVLEGMKLQGELLTGEEAVSTEKNAVTMPAKSICILK